MELIILPNTLFVCSGIVTGSFVSKIGMLEAEAWMGWAIQSSDLKLHSQGSTCRLHISSAIVAEALDILSARLADQVVDISSLVCFSECQDLIRLFSAGGHERASKSSVWYSSFGLLVFFYSLSLCCMLGHCCHGFSSQIACITSSFDGV